MEKTPQELTALVGREVYSNNGVFVGEVEDVVLDLDAQTVTALALAYVNNGLFSELITESDRGILVPYRWVMAVGDIVIANEIVERCGNEDGSARAE